MAYFAIFAYERGLLAFVLERNREVLFATYFFSSDRSGYWHGSGFWTLDTALRVVTFEFGVSKYSLKRFGWTQITGTFEPCPMKHDSCVLIIDQDLGVLLGT